jgi:hypothetical protein
MVVPDNPKREQVLRLIDQKDKIEKRIAELGEILVVVRKFKPFKNSIRV